MIKKILLFFISTGIFNCVDAQNIIYPHATTYFHFGITQPVNDKWDIYVNSTIRRQNDFHLSTHNLLDVELSELYRLWIYYKLSPNVTIQFNPISYYHVKPFYGKETDYIKPDNIEWRTAIGTELTQKNADFTFKEKQTYEFRFLKSLNNVPIGRLRLKNTVQYAVSKQWKLAVWDDLQISMPPNRPKNIFDQNWFAAGWVYAGFQNATIELYYMRNRTERNSGIEFDVENGVYLNLEIRL